MSNIKTIKVNLGFKPFPVQREVVNAFKDPNVFGITVVASRQSGKTHIANNLIIDSALRYSGIKILVVLPFQSQLKKNFKQVYRKLSKSDILIKKKLESQGETMIELTNGSEIYWRSAHAKESLRGITCQMVFTDESATIDKSILDEIILPMLTTKSKFPKKLFVGGTPKGKKNWLYGHFNLALTNTRNKSFRWSYRENPLADMDFIDDQRKSMPEQIFKQEFESEWIDGSELFNEITDVCSLKPSLTKEEVFIGVDIGFNDKTVVSVFNKDKKQVGLHYQQSDNTDQLVNFIVNSCNQYNYKDVYIEVNGIGKPIYDLVKPKLKKSTKWVTTSKSKTDIINKYIMAFNNKEIKLIDDDLQVYEHGTFQYFPDSGRFAAASTATDDIIMSNAIAFECMTKGIKKGSYVFI